MPDDLSKKVPDDRCRISTEPDQAQYWANTFGVSKERLLEAVRKAGFAPEAVGRELKRAVSKWRAGQEAPRILRVVLRSAGGRHRLDQPAGFPAA